MIATATLTPPEGTVTDFSALLDLSTLPSAWWASIDTSDPTRGRVFDSAGNRLAVDWLPGFSRANRVGWARVLIPGALTPESDLSVSVHAPRAARASVADGDTYGRFAAYDEHWLAYWPLHDRADRTGQHDATSIFGAAPNSLDGVVGRAVSTSAAQERMGAGGVDLSGRTVFTVMGWINDSKTNQDTAANASVILAQHSTAGNRPFYLMKNQNSRAMRFMVNDSAAAVDGAVETGIGAWVHAAGVKRADEIALYVNGAADGTDEYEGDTTGSATTLIGNWQNSTQRAPLGGLDDIQVHATDRSAAWIAFEVAQASDPEAAYGAWSLADDGLGVGAVRRGVGRRRRRRARR